jgi:hypothetical protein
MSFASWHAAVVGVGVLIILCSRLAEARVHPSHGGSLATTRRNNVPGGVGGCAMAVEPFGYPCEEHEVRPLCTRTEFDMIDQIKCTHDQSVQSIYPW